MHGINWWAVALCISVVAKNSVTYMPIPASAPGFISSPWYPMIYHGMQGVLALNFTGSAVAMKETKALEAANGK